VLSLGAGVVACLLAGFVLYGTGSHLEVAMTEGGAMPTWWDLLDKRPLLVGLLVMVAVAVAVPAAMRRRPAPDERPGP
jgi:hypothetical protein